MAADTANAILSLNALNFSIDSTPGHKATMVMILFGPTRDNDLD